MQLQRNKIFSDQNLKINQSEQLPTVSIQDNPYINGLGMNNIKFYTNQSDYPSISNQQQYNDIYNQYNTEPMSGDSVFDTVSLIVRRNEVGNPNNWTVTENLHDGGGLTVGAYQFTESSGVAKELARNLGFKSVYDKGFKQALGTREGIAMQHQLFKKHFYNPAIKKAAQLGLKDPRAVAFLIDTNLNGGLNSVIRRAKKKGAVNLNTLVQARNERYRYLANKNPSKYGRFLEGWIKRSNSFLTM